MGGGEEGGMLQLTASRLPSELPGEAGGRGQLKHLNLPADVHKSLCVITCNIISALRPVHEAVH